MFKLIFGCLFLICWSKPQYANSRIPFQGQLCENYCGPRIDSLISSFELEQIKKLRTLTFAEWSFMTGTSVLGLASGVVGAVFPPALALGTSVSLLMPFISQPLGLLKRADKKLAKLLEASYIYLDLVDKNNPQKKLRARYRLQRFLVKYIQKTYPKSILTLNDIAKQLVFANRFMFKFYIRYSVRRKNIPQIFIDPSELDQLRKIVRNPGKWKSQIVVMLFSHGKARNAFELLYHLQVLPSLRDHFQSFDKS